MFKAMVRSSNYEIIQSIGYKADFDKGTLLVENGDLKISVSPSAKQTVIVLEHKGQMSMLNVASGTRTKVDVGGLNGYVCLFATGEQTCYVQIDPVEIVKYHYEELAKAN